MSLSIEDCQTDYYIKPKDLNPKCSDLLITEYLKEQKLFKYFAFNIDMKTKIDDKFESEPGTLAERGSNFTCNVFQSPRGYIITKKGLACIKNKENPILEFDLRTPGVYLTQTGYDALKGADRGLFKEAEQTKEGFIGMLTRNKPISYYSYTVFAKGKIIDRSQRDISIPDSVTTKVYELINKDNVTDVNAIFEHLHTQATSSQSGGSKNKIRSRKRKSINKRKTRKSMNRKKYKKSSYRRKNKSKRN